MNLNSIRFVLVAPSHPGNIGAAARAIKTMGFSRLYLVNPKSFPDQVATDRSAGSEDILNAAIVTTSLQEALTGCQLVIATSARRRHLAIENLTPSGAAQLVNQQSDETEIAIIFGREHAGLTNEELSYSHYHVMIPTNSDYSSLNLAHSVQIIAYELRMIYLTGAIQSTTDAKNSLATTDSIAFLYEHLEKVLKDINFLKPTNQVAFSRLKRVINRAHLEQIEVNMLRGILTQIQQVISNKDS